MPLSGEYEPSPQAWVANQVKAFEESGGTAGNTLRGVPVVILWTRGRKSGTVRKTPLMRVEHDGVYAVVASMGGAPKHPVWYLNLQADPRVSLQDGADVFDGVAREVTGHEKAEWWKRAVSVWPDYEPYQERTTREIPVLVVERTD